MTIYDLSNAEKNPHKEGDTFQEPDTSYKKRDRFFSSLAARLFFLLLLAADLLWGAYSLCLVAASAIGSIFTLFHVPFFKNLLARSWFSLKRALVCALSLFVALFSPSFGIMIACTYFLMYDKAGIDEVIPSSLQEQFKEFFPSSQQ